MSKHYTSYQHNLSMSGYFILDGWWPRWVEGSKEYAEVTIGSLSITFTPDRIDFPYNTLNIIEEAYNAGFKDGANNKEGE